MSLWVMAWSFAYWLGNTTSISPLYRTFTATAFGIYVLIKVKSYSGSTPAAFSVWTLTVDLTNTTLGRCWGGASQAPAAMLAHKGFIVCIIGVFYNFIISLMRPSLSSIIL